MPAMTLLCALVLAPVPNGWWSADWPYRVAVTLPATARPRPAAPLGLEATVDLAAAASRLTGTAVTVDPDSLRVVAADGSGAWVAREAGGRVSWTVPAAPAAAAPALYWLYFRPTGAPPPATPAPAATPWTPAPDYATEATGAPWDLSAIEQFGDKPEFIRHTFEDGVLKLQVREDPYFIWGRMWGPLQPGDEPLDIDLSRFNLLQIRLRQDVPSARWSTFGRQGLNETLRSYDFMVNGTDWQTVRVDLDRHAAWRGQLSAFRIDPSHGIEANIEIESVLLLALAAVDVGDLETLGSAELAPDALTLADTGPLGLEETVELQLRATRDGAPLAGTPVTVELAEPLNGALGAAAGWPSEGAGPGRRVGLTDAAGELRLNLTTGTLAGPDVLALTASAAGGELLVSSAVDLTAGPPASYTWSATRPTILAPGETSAALELQLADAHGNPLAVAGRQVRLSGPAGVSFGAAQVVTDAAGRAPVRVTFDPAQCWVAWLEARDEQGASGRSAAVCYTPDQRDWGVTMADNGYFQQPDGRGWLALGGFYANWVGNVPATGEKGTERHSFVDVDDAGKTAWLAFLAEQGVTSLRFMLRAHRPGGMEPMDIGGRVNPELYAEALHYMDLARPFGIRFMVTLHEDYDKPVYVNENYRQRFVLPRWSEDELAAATPAQRRFLVEGRLVDGPADRYTDPEAIACQDQYTRELVGLLRDNPQIFAYEFENEMVNVPPEWINHQLAVIRELDPRTPIGMSHGGNGLHTGDPAYWHATADLDYFNYHLYPPLSARVGADYGLTVATLARYGRAVGRCFLGESVGDEFYHPSADETMRRRVARDTIWFSLTEGNPGVYFWNHRGYEIEEFRLAAQLAGGLDFGAWVPRPLVPTIAAEHPLDDDKYFRSPAGFELLTALHQAVGASLRSGRVADIALGPVVAAPAGPPAVTPSPGYEVSAWTSASGDQGLAYVRNRAGDERWAPDGTEAAMLRTTAPAQARLQFALPPGEYAVSLANLVTGAVADGPLAADELLDLGLSEDDWGLSWRRVD